MGTSAGFNETDCAEVTPTAAEPATATTMAEPSSSVDDPASDGADATEGAADTSSTETPTSAAAGQAFMFTTTIAMLFSLIGFLQL